MKTINFSKKIAIVFSLLISCLHGIGQETDPLMSNFFIYATGATGKAGSTAELTLNMYNSEPICAWTCNLVLPEGVTFQSVALIKDRQPEGYEAEPVATCQEDGSVTITCEGTKEIGLTGTDGAIASVMVEIADTITSGRHIVGVRDAFFVVVDELGFYEKAYTEFKWFIKGNDLPLVEEGKVWSYKRSRLIAPTDVQAEWNEIYSLEGDTVIDSRRCMKLYVTSDNPSESHDHSYLGAMYEEGECVYYIASGSTTHSLLYDFSCEPGNIVKVNQFELAINERKIVKYRGKYLTVIDWSPIEEGEETFYHNIWIEGIGSPLDLLNDTPIWYDGCPYKELVTCKLNGQVIYDKNDFEASAQPVPKEETSQELFPEGTKWIEIRLDTLEHNSWYSKIEGEWVPNFETIEYNVEGKFILNWNSQDNYTYRYGIDTNSPDWSDSPAFMIYEDKSGDDTNISAAVPSYGENGFIRGEVYQFNWYVGKKLYYQETVGVDDMPLPDGAAMPNVSSFEGEFPVGAIHEFGTIEEIKEGDFGGVRPLEYVDLNGVRIIHGIGVTEWNDGECLFGPANLYNNSFYFKGTPPERHYRSMLVHFERNGEVIYDVWPAKEATTEEPITFTEGQMATIILPTEPEASKGKYYRLDRVEDRQIIFEQELQPQAHIPYIIVPSEDFSIDLSTLDLAGCYRDTVSVDGVSFIGSFVSEAFDYQDGFYIDIIDTTPDCRFDESCVIGALRAYLLVRWDDPYNQGGTRVPPLEKLEVVLHDNGTGINNINIKDNGYIYDLQGRKIAKPQKGINIIRYSDGTTRKVSVK